MIRKISFILAFVLITVLAFAQDVEDTPEDIRIEMPRFSLRLNAGIPNTISNEVFRRKFVGIYEVNLGANVNLSKKLFIGIGFKNALMAVTNKVQYGVNTKMQLNSAYFKIGYNHFHTNQIFSTFYIQGGLNKSIFTHVIPHNDSIPDKHWSASLIEPGYSINFYAEDNLTLGFYTSYSYLDKPFDPKQVNFQHHIKDISKLNTSKNTSYLNIGLEMYIGIGKKKN